MGELDLSRHMRRDRLRETVPTITPRNLNLFIMYASGISVKEIAEQAGIRPATVRQHIARVKREIDTIDVKNLQKGVMALYPLGFKALKHNLKKKDVKTTIQFMKGIKAFVSHQTQDSRTLNFHLHKVADKLRLGRGDVEDVEDIGDE